MYKDKTTNYDKAIFAGGCFWCMEYIFGNINGVMEVFSGYTGGETENPSYEEVKTGKTGHYEAILVKFDSNLVSYKDLLEIYWKHIDPTDPEGQFVDRGTQYRTAIFYLNEEQKQEAEISKKKLEDSGIFKKAIVTKILPAGKFFMAEDYHQHFHKKNPEIFKQNKEESGRMKFIDSVWKKHKDFKLFN